MDQPDLRLTAFVARARQLDEAALTALGNRGLLRRARKDLARTAIEVGVPNDDALPVVVDDATVTLRLVPADSTCSCPASGTCRHRIAAWLHVASLEVGASDASATSAAESAVESPPHAADPFDALLELDDAALAAYAGKPTLRRALGELAAGWTVTFDGAGAARIPAAGVALRFLAGDDPAASTCSCHADRACVHRVAAIAAAQLGAGRRSLAVTGDRSASGEAPRSRSDVLATARQVLVDALGFGLTRVSASTVDRLRTLATSAHGVDLPRLERELRGLAGELAAIRGREASADVGVAVGRMARLSALVEALEHGTPGLVGRHRARFATVGELELIGVGAAAFETRSGHRGLTLWFRDVGRGAWCTWTDVRPGDLRGFDPIARFDAPGPWGGCPSPRAAIGAAARLVNAWRSDDERLSARAATRFVPGERIDPTTLPAVTRWTDLAAPARAALGLRLVEAPATASVALLAPAAVEDRGFDPITQRYAATLVDVDDRRFPVRLDHRLLGDGGLARVEAVDDAAWRLVLVRMRLFDGELAAEPLTLLGAKKPWFPTLPDVGARPSPTRIAKGTRPAPDIDDDPDADPPDDSDRWTPTAADDPIGARLNAILGTLVDAADRGTREPLSSDDLRSGQDLISVLGWSSFDATWRALVTARTAGDRGRALLRAVHIVDLAARAWLLRQRLGTDHGSRPMLG